MDSSVNDFLGCSHDVVNRNDMSGNVKPFCTQDSWQESVKLLSNELELLGYSPLYFLEQGEPQLDIVCMINTTWSMFQSYRSCLKVISDMEDRLNRAQCDIDNLQQVKIRQKSMLDLKERQAAEREERERQAKVLLQNEEDHAIRLKEELRKLNSLMVDRDSRFTHEIKRKDREILKLKERLLKVLGERVQVVNGSQSSVEILYPLSRLGTGQRSKWKTDSSEMKKDDELHKKIIEDYISRQDKLIEENVAMRESFYQFLYDVSCLLQKEPLEFKPVLVPLEISRENFLEKVNELKNDLTRAFGEITEQNDSNDLSGKLAAKELEVNELKEALCLNTVLKAAVPMSDVSNQGMGSEGPSWSLGTCRYTLPPSGKFSTSAGTRIVGQRRTVARGDSRDANLSPRASPPPSVKMRDARMKSQRPRSANFSPSPQRMMLQKSFSRRTPESSDQESKLINLRTRTGSLSPTTSVERAMNGAKRKTHPRTTISDSEAPNRGATLPNRCLMHHKRTVTTPDSATSGIGSIGAISLVDDDETLEVKLERLSQLIEDKLSESGREAELDHHLENVRKALLQQKFRNQRT